MTRHRSEDATQGGRGSSRRRVKEEHKPKEVKEKFMEQRKQDIATKPLKAMNQRQQEYIDLLKIKALTIATGYAGTSKTYIPTVMACDDFRLNKVRKLIFSRPATSKSKSVGYTKGTHTEKMAMWLAPVMDILVQRLGRAVLEEALAKGDVVFIPLETIKGLSANDCWIIIDEAEDLTIEEAETVVTRQGYNCTMALCGDLRQSDLKERSGLLHLKQVAEKHNLDVGIVDFNSPEDIVRSKACRAWVVALAQHHKQL